MAQEYKKPLVKLDKSWRSMTDDERRDALALMRDEFRKILDDLAVDINRTFDEYGIPLTVELEPTFKTSGNAAFTDLTEYYT